MDAVKCKALITASETGNLTRTAEKLGYTQSGISRMIDALEEEAGFRLMNRSKKGVALTGDGEAMMPAFREIVRAEEAAAELAAKIAGSVIGKVTVGSYHSAAAGMMPELISLFREKYPQVTVSMREGRFFELKKWLDEGAVDFCICAGNSMTEQYRWIPLHRDKIAVWLPADHEVKTKTYPMPRLAEERLILTDPGTGTEIDDLLEREMPGVTADITSKDEFTIYRMVEAGLGISINQMSMTAFWNGDVRVLPLSPARYVEMGMMLPERGLSPAAKRFAEECEKYVKERNR